MLKALLDIFFPPTCFGCGTYIPNAGKVHLCSDCLGRMSPVTTPLCSVCGTPFATDGGIDHRCGSCIASPPAFATARSAAVLEERGKELIHRLKYGRQPRVRAPLGHLVAERLAEHGHSVAADVVTPVPLHERKLRQRGYNQSLLLAQTVSKRWGVPLVVDLLQRERWTESQTSLPAAERPMNVKGVFSVVRPERVAGRTVLLVDDVFTTGSTLHHCSLALKKAGAAAVHAVTVARAL